MKRYRLLLLFVFLVIFLIAGRAEALDVAVDGETVSRQAELVEGSAYIPLRELLDVLGGWDITWDQDSRTATAEGELFTLVLPTESSIAQVDGYPIDLGLPVLLQGNTSYVPLRAAANLCGAAVTWNGTEQPITLSPSPGSDAYSQEDLLWLSRIISAESRGEPLWGQIAVGNVVLNRVAHPDFPDTIQGVIFDDVYAIQFEPVENGTVYADPVPSSVLAARMALSGTQAVGNCLYFYNPALSQDTWIASHRTYYATIGSHRFFL